MILHHSYLVIMALILLIIGSSATLGFAYFTPSLRFVLDWTVITAWPRDFVLDELDLLGLLARSGFFRV